MAPPGPKSSSCSKSGAGVASIFADRCPPRFFSRRDYRTQPGVLTPGTNIKRVRPESGGREEFSALDGEPDPQRISASPSRPSLLSMGPGLKPQAQFYSPRPHRYAKRCGPGLRDKNSTRPKYLSPFSKPHQAVPAMFEPDLERAWVRAGVRVGTPWFNHAIFEPVLTEAP